MHEILSPGTWNMLVAVVSGEDFYNLQGHDDSTKLTEGTLNLFKKVSLRSWNLSSFVLR